MRGKGKRSWTASLKAGKSRQSHQTSHLTRDYPRVCGEKIRGRGTANIWQGSPLRVRGKVMSQPDGAIYVGITPAYAGKSKEVNNYAVYHWDHPRACGEKSAQVQCLPRLSGSPPRMRGKEQLASGVRSSAGITPACAGKSGCSWAMYWRRWDHPRICGEKALGNSIALPQWGSPPRVRGKAVRNVGIALAVGITPAYAGKSP